MHQKDDTTRPPDADDRLEAGAPRRRYRLATPLSLAIALGCIAAVAGLWLVTLQRVAFEREQAVASAMQSNANLAIAFEQQVVRTLKAAEQVAAFVREQYLQQGTDINLRDWVARGVIREPMFTIISVVNEQGDIVSSSQETGAVNYSDRSFFQALQRSERDELFVSEPVLGRVSGQWRIPMALRIVREGGRFGGVVVMSVDPTNFTDFYRQADLGAQGLLELTGLDGVVRGRKSGGKVSFGADARSLPWFQRQAAAPEDDLIDAHGAVDGVPRILSYRSMVGHPLMVTVGSAFSEVLEPVMQRRAGYLALAAGASVALLCFGALLIVVLARQRAVADALASSEGLFRATFHQAATGIAHITPEGRILRANDKFCRMLGYSLQELRQRDLFALSDEGEREAVRRFLAQRLVAHSPVLSPEMEKAYRRKDGGLLWVYEALGLVKDAQGRPDFLVVVTQDISAHKELETRLSHDALHDALTGLPNRVMFNDRFARVLESARRYGRRAAVLYVDLDGFKSVNDQWGHAAGDQLLQQVARRLEDCVRAEDTVARLGGDEFGIVLAAIDQVEDCEVVADKVLSAMAQPFVLDSAVAQVSASVGAGLYPRHGSDAEALLAQADAAMYAAKQAGKNRFSTDTTPSPLAE
ncbi:PAS domain S-box-containing protein/diguanylate cyclase (GGDEF)-like protein [Acidovorax sp. 94]|uniref:sensor domain-containing diguanylate cyclase n=1 Tax=Acidovorax sp. 94 TaxID=2135633 RepID=UPI000EB06CC5|nr:diguanylate cyclase [Acidovorax sp. 94]RKR67525.1 PAS domain S-box-containing protein/diguanylate cyclase (GGDEF)-like protein [Acidovorax sp. 94]